MGADMEAVKERCIFTTHTPVPAGHDLFSLDLMPHVIGEKKGQFDLKDTHIVEVIDRILGISDELSDFKELLYADKTVNMTLLALNFSHYDNGVAKRHGEHP